MLLAGEEVKLRHLAITVPAGAGDRALVCHAQGISLAANHGVCQSLRGTTARRLSHDPEFAELCDGGDDGARAGQWDSEAGISAGGYDGFYFLGDLRRVGIIWGDADDRAVSGNYVCGVAETDQREKKDTFGKMLAFGIASMVGLQAIINIAVATVSVPTKGLSLPLVSAGGSGLVITCARRPGIAGERLPVRV